MNDNTVTIIGNATRDPELRYTQSGRAVANIGVAWNTRKRNPETNQWEDGEVSFFNVTVWGDLGEHVAQSIGKGQRVIVVGRLRQRGWEDEDGNKRSAVEIVADEIGPSLKWGTTTYDRAERTTQAPPLDNLPDKEYAAEEPF